MKKKYTKKQIMESIKYWKKQLKRLDEDFYNPQPNEPAWTKQFMHRGNVSLSHCVTPDDIKKEIRFFDNQYSPGNDPTVIEVGVLLYKGSSLEDATDLYNVGFIYDGKFSRMLDEVENDARRRIEEILDDSSMVGYNYEMSNAIITKKPSYDYDWLTI